MTHRLALATLLLVASFTVFTFGVASKLTFPYAINYGEGVLLDQARRVSEAPGLYPPFDAAPYVIDNYPPVYPVLLAWLPGPEGKPFFTGRLISVLATLVSAWMIALLVRRWSGDVEALCAAALFLALPEIVRFAEFVRIDALALAFGLVGLVCLQRPRVSWRVLALVAFFLSIYTRHSMFALPLVGFIELLRREGRSALAWPVSLLIAGVAGYVGLHAWSGGHVYDHLIHFNALDYSWRSLPDPNDPRIRSPIGTVEKWFATFYPLRYPLVFAAFLGLLPLAAATGPGAARLRRGPHLWGMALCGIGAVLALVPVVVDSVRRGFLGWIHQDSAHLYDNLVWANALLGVGVLMATWRQLNARPVPDTPSLALLLAAGAASAALIGRMGSDVNYLFELCAVLCLVTGVAMSRGPAPLRWVVQGLVVFTIVVGVMQLRAGSPDSSPERRAAIAQRAQRLIDRLERYPGRILTEDPALPVLAGRALEYEPFMYGRLIEMGLWDPAPLEREIREQRFSAIVFSASGISPDPADHPMQVGIWVFTPENYPRRIRDDSVRQHYQPDDTHEVLEQVTPILWRRWQIWVPQPR